MDSYAEIQNIAEYILRKFIKFVKFSTTFLNSSETNEIMDNFEPSFCKDRIRRRWELQITRHGQRLSECLMVSTAEVRAWNDYVNELHHSAQVSYL